MRRFSEWLIQKWTRGIDIRQLAQDYQVIFSTAQGQRVLKHWLDNVYCSIYEGVSEKELWMHNGRRSFVHEILVNLDIAEYPDKYRIEVETDKEG